jgi:hypothetical protein
MSGLKLRKSSNARDQIPAIGWFSSTKRKRDVYLKERTRISLMRSHVRTGKWPAIVVIQKHKAFTE